MAGKRQVARRSATQVTESEKAYGRTATRLQVARAVWALWERVRAEEGVDQQWLADRLGKDKSWASRLLKGPGNWTLDTLGDLLEAMKGRLTLVEAHTYDEIKDGRALAAKRHRKIYLMSMVVVEEEDGEEVDLTEIGWSEPLASPDFQPSRQPLIEVEPA